MLSFKYTAFNRNHYVFMYISDFWNEFLIIIIFIETKTKYYVFMNKGILVQLFNS